MIFFAYYQNQIVGTASLLKIEEYVFELCKMAVTQSSQGRGVGKVLLEHCLTGASGMAIQQTRMDVIANNLANVDKTAFKRDTTLFKAFPEMIIHRYDEDGDRKIPLVSFDTAPVVGKLGLVGEVNEVYTRFEQG